MHKKKRLSSEDSRFFEFEVESLMWMDFNLKPMFQTSNIL